MNRIDESVDLSPAAADYQALAERLERIEADVKQQVDYIVALKEQIERLIAAPQEIVRRLGAARKVLSALDYHGLTDTVKPIIRAVSELLVKTSEIAEKATDGPRNSDELAWCEDCGGAWYKNELNGIGLCAQCSWEQDHHAEA